MCGIVGHVGPVAVPSERSLEVLLDGLSRLEYRGYDSAGVALLTDEGVSVRKEAGKLENLRAQIAAHPVAPATAGIGHTRWATHGSPTAANAHPHVAGHIALAHNGIIENFRPLREEVESLGRTLLSETDSEVVAHLLDIAYSALREANPAGDPALQLREAMAQVTPRLEGTYALLAITADAPGTIVAARRSSPLVLGVGEGENFVGSDVAAFVAFTKQAVEVDDDQIVLITAAGIEITDAAGQVVTEPHGWEVTWDASAAVKGGYDTFMNKEIHDQPTAVADTLRGRMDDAGELQLDEMRIDPSVLRSVDKIIVVACGTAAYAGHVAKYAIEHWCRLPVEIELAVLYTHAGPEVAVASTKAFLAQITACYLLGLYLAQLRGNKWPEEVADYLANLSAMPERIQRFLDESEEQVRALGRELADNNSFLFLGRHVGYPVALEGALKLKELAYVHAEGFAAGELKHGPIALVEEGLPVFVIVPTPRRPVLHDKVISNIEEIRARGARTIVIAEEEDHAVDAFAHDVIRVPAAPTLMMPLLSVVPLQVFASALAQAKGYDVDQPRNLAKSVTVE